MWRRFRFVVMLLVVGAGVNVAVAWGMGLLAGSIRGYLHFSGAGAGRVAICVGGIGHERATIIDFPPMPDPASSAWWNSVLVASPGPERTAWARGWPMLSVAAWGDSATGTAEPYPDEWIIHQGVVWNPNGWPSRLFDTKSTGSLVLPFMPVWPGFFVNTLFYAAVVGLLRCGPGFVRTRIRAWRGQCNRCGYPRGESSTCSECGAAVKPRVTSAPMVQWHPLREKGPED